MDIETRFLEHVKKRLLDNIIIDANGCWLWQGYCQKFGYGQTRIANHPHTVHRLSYQVYKGPFYQWFQVLHTCDVRNCVNPDHLFLGTHDDNMKDMQRKGRASKAVTNPDGRPARLNECIRREIAWKYINERDHTIKSLAECYHTTMRIVQTAINRFKA